MHSENQISPECCVLVKTNKKFAVCSVGSAFLCEQQSGRIVRDFQVESSQGIHQTSFLSYEPRREKTRFLYMRKQRRRSASR